MAYRLRSVLKYTQDISTQLGKNKPEGIEKQKDWKASIRQAKTYSNALEAIQTETNLANLAWAVHCLAQYLIDQQTPVTQERATVIEKYINKLTAQYEAFPTPVKIYAPNPIARPKVIEDYYNASKHVGNQFRLKHARYSYYRDELAQEEAVGDFLDSNEFCKLKDYLATLTHDTRDHTYLCGLIDMTVNKVPALTRLINKLETQATMEDVKEVLKEFYSEKNLVISEDRTSRRKEQERVWHASDYDVLNKGQNWFTRFFPVRTSTICLINELAKSIGYDPEITEKVNRREEPHSFKAIDQK